MAKPPIKRHYDGSDAYMTESARTILTLFETDRPDFAAFDSTFTSTFESDFNDALVAAETVVDDTAIQGQQMQLGESVEASMNAARAKAAEVKYFVLKAFPDSPGTQFEFGLHTYDAARRSQPRMAQYLDDLGKAATKYSAQLIAKGYSAPRIADIQLVHIALLGDNGAQETFKKRRPKTTEERVIVLNAAYSKMAQVNDAAGLVYASDPVKRAQYTYDPYGDGDDVAEYSGTVDAAAAKIVVAMTDYDADRMISLRNTGTVPVSFYITTGGLAKEGSEVELGGGAIINKTMSEMNSDEAARTLVVKNGDAETAGSYEVEVDMDGGD